MQENLTQSTQAKSTVDIGNRVELLLDDWLIERHENVSWQVQEPRREEIVWALEKPWESKTSAYFAVLQDDDAIRLYHRGAADDITCYLESRDGIHFERPNLGIYEYEGSTENNIVYRGRESHNMAVFRDPNPDVPEEERYKAVGGERYELSAIASPDAIHWKPFRQGHVEMPGAFDSLNVAFWDEVAGCYRCYARVWVRPDGTTDKARGEDMCVGVRNIQVSTSTDFVEWTPPKPIQYTGHAPLEEFYTNAIHPVPNAPHVLVGFPMRIVLDRQKVEEHASKGVSDSVFMSSRDGEVWHRHTTDSWLRPGPDRCNWTDRNSITAWGIVQTSASEYSMYISEHYKWPDNRLRRLSIRRDGFVELFAEKTGEFTTRPLIFSGKNLILNYRTSAPGSIQVEVQDEVGQTLPGFGLDEMEPLYGDELDAKVLWKNQPDVSSLVGRAVRLRCVLNGAALYSLRTGDA